MAIVTLNNEAAPVWAYFSVDHKIGETAALQLKPSSGTVSIDWGDGTITGNADPNQTFVHTFNSNVSQIGVRASLGLDSITELQSTSINFNGDVSQFNLLQGLKTLILLSTNLSGNIASIRNGMEYLTLHFPIVGQLSDLPNTLIEFTSESPSANITGDFSDLPTSLEVLILNNSSITGSINNFISTFRHLRLRANTGNITGNIQNLPIPMTNFYVISSNGITGSIESLPNIMSEFYLVGGSNLLEGNLDNIPPNLRILVVHGVNTISGNINSLSNILEFLDIQGSNTISGDISNIPNNVAIFIIIGANTITGNVENIVSRTFIVDGNNTLSGNLGGIPILSPAQQVSIGGNNSVVNSSLKDYTGQTRLILVVDSVSAGFISSHVDQLLIDLANANVQCTLSLIGATRTSNSDSAYTTLSNNGSIINFS